VGAKWLQHGEDGGEKEEQCGSKAEAGAADGAVCALDRSVLVV
jgi:hypothetical protein